MFIDGQKLISECEPTIEYCFVRIVFIRKEILNARTYKSSGCIYRR